MPSYDVYSGDSSVLATKINSTQTTGITIAAMNINGTLTGWANTAGVIEVSEQSDSTLKREWIYYTGTSVNATTKVATLSGVVRGITSTSSDVTSGGTGVAFSKGAIVRFVTFHDLLNKKANLDRAGTITATWTFGTSGKIAFSSTSTEGFVNQGLTTAQRDAVASWTNGAQIYNTSLGQTQWREGGAWVTNAVGSTVADASTTVAGKAEEAILSEVSAGTPTGGTGARLFINPSLVKKTSSGAAEGNVVALNSAAMVDGSIGGTGVATPDLGALLIGGGAGQAMTSLIGTASGQVPTWNGTTLAMTQAVPTGAVFPWTIRTAPTNYLLCNGTAVSRSTYSALFSTIAPTIGTVTITLASPGVFTKSSHGLLRGDAVYLTTTGALPTGLTANTIYYVIAAGLTANEFQLSATIDGSAINTSVSQSGTHTLVSCPFGLGDGSTTFNVPDLRGRMVAGDDKMGTTAASNLTATNPALGITGGAANASHTHTPTTAIATNSGGATQFHTAIAAANAMPSYMTLFYIIRI